MSGRRERSKALRRTAILDATLDLLDTVPAAELTTEQIATRAKVSHATVFNLVGTRQQLMYALLERQMEAIAELLTERQAEFEDDPISGAIEIIDACVAAYAANANAFRQIIVEVDSRQAPIHASPNLQSLVECFCIAQDRGMLDSAFDATALGLQVLATYALSMLGWAAGRLEEDGWALAAKHELYTVLAAAGTDEYQAQFRSELLALSKEYAAARPWG